MRIGPGATKNQRRLVAACLDLGVPFWWRGAGNLLIPNHALRFVIESLEAAGAQVVGLEGFDLESGVIHPRLDLIYDRATAGARSALDIADGWGSEVWVDVTLGGDAR